MLAIILAVVIVLQIASPATAQSPTRENAQESSGNLQPPSIPTTGINLTISPTFMSLVTDPGKSVSSSVNIRNNSNITEYLKIDLAKFEPADGGERPLISEIESNDDFADWISFSEDRFTVGPNETKNIQISITPNEEAALGYYYAIIFNRIQDSVQTTTGTAVSGAPALLTLLEVRSPYAKKELQLEEVTTDKLFYEYLPVEFRVKVKNSGNIHTAPVGEIFVDQGGNKDIAIFPVNESRGNVLPESSRTFTSVWDDGFIVRVPKTEDGDLVYDNKGNVKYETKWDFSKADKFRIGKYTANVLLIYNDGEKDVPLEGQVSFWVLPWKIMLGVGIVIVLLLIGLKVTVFDSIFRKKK